MTRAGVVGRAAVVAALVAGVLVLAYPGYRETHFADARAARPPGQARRIPAFVPDDAREIRTLTNLDTMQSWGCFQLPGGTRDLRLRLAADGAVRHDGEALPRAEKMFGRVAWWPPAMSEPGVERYDLPDAAGTTMVGLSARDDRVCFYAGGNAG